MAKSCFEAHRSYSTVYIPPGYLRSYSYKAYLTAKIRSRRLVELADNRIVVAVEIHFNTIRGLPFACVGGWNDAHSSPVWVMVDTSEVWPIEQVFSVLKDVGREPHIVL